MFRQKCNSKEVPTLISPCCILGTLMMALLLVACGGGGGGDGGGGNGGDTPLPISYSGLSTPALIDDENATIIAVSALNGVEYQAPSSSIIALNYPDQSTNQTQGIFLANLNRAIRNAAASMDISSNIATSIPAALESESGTLSGACGGTAAYNIAVNDNMSAFTGSITYYSLCEDGISISGVATFNGDLDLATETMLTFNIGYSNITTTSGSHSVTMNGKIGVTFTHPYDTTTMNMLIRDNTTNQTFKLENYLIISSETNGYEEISISGRFYYPEYGYVNIETIEEIRLHYLDEYPSSGILLSTGANGSAGSPTIALLTILSADAFQVEADTNGDGIYDYNSGPIGWDEP